jgi:hypothetical protein
MNIGSFFTSIWNGIKSISKLWTSSAVGTAIDNAATAAWKELQVLAPQALEAVATSGTTAILAAMGASSPTSVVIAAGIAAAEAAFKAQGVTVAQTTLSTFTSALHTAVSAPQSTTTASTALAAFGPATDTSALIAQFEALAVKLRADADAMRAAKN